jgi:hypothetical protein
VLASVPRHPPTPISPARSLNAAYRRLSANSRFNWRNRLPDNVVAGARIVEIVLARAKTPCNLGVYFK